MVGERKGIMQSSSIIHINLLPPSRKALPFNLLLGNYMMACAPVLFWYDSWQVSSWATGGWCGHFVTSACWDIKGEGLPCKWWEGGASRGCVWPENGHEGKEL